MIDTLEALLVALIAVLPGSLFTIALVHRGASWAWQKDDIANQVVAFLGVSAMFHAAFAPVTFLAYRKLIANDAIESGRVSPWWWLLPVVYVALPYAVGAVVANSRRWDADSPWPQKALKWLLSFVTARTPEPRAWDRVLSSPDSTGWLRLTLKNGDVKAGLWERPSFASGYGEEADLYLYEQAQLGKNGGFVVDGDGQPKTLGAGLLIRWDEVLYLELINWRDDEGDATS